MEEKITDYNIKAILFTLSHEVHEPDSKNHKKTKDIQTNFAFTFILTHNPD